MLENMIKGARKKIAAFALAGALLFNSGCTTYKNAIQPDSIKSVESSEKYESNEGLGVFLIDMQPKFLEKIDKKEQDKEIPKMIEVLDYCKKTKTPVFVLEYEWMGNTIDKLKNKLDEIEDVTYVIKEEDDGFLFTRLYNRLDKKKISHILLMGINASGCVMQTANSGITFGEKIITSSELIAEPKDWGDNESIGWYKEHGACLSFQDLIARLKEGKINKYRFPESKKREVESDKYKFIPEKAWEEEVFIRGRYSWDQIYTSIIWDKNKSRVYDRDDELFMDFNEDNIPDMPLHDWLKLTDQL